MRDFKNPNQTFDQNVMDAILAGLSDEEIIKAVGIDKWAYENAVKTLKKRYKINEELNRDTLREGIKMTIERHKKENDRLEEVDGDIFKTKTELKTTNETIRNRINTGKTNIKWYEDKLRIKEVK